MFNRPIVQNNGQVRLVKGFDSSYRRMPADRPASTVTTNSSHIGSDNKIHPWEHRVLSILECADLQTVPRCFDWSFALETKRNYLVRNLVGEAFPPYFTYLHGKVIRDLLLHRLQARLQLAVRDN
jgi:DNA (cytosine-5)-methyltransferase 1